MTLVFGPLFLWDGRLLALVPCSSVVNFLLSVSHLLSQWLFHLLNYWGTFSWPHLYFTPIHTCSISAWWPISAFILFRSTRWPHLLDGALLADLVTFLHFPTMPFLGLFTLGSVPQLPKFSLFFCISQLASALSAEFWKDWASRKGVSEWDWRGRGKKLGYFSHPLASGSISGKN